MNTAPHLRSARVLVLASFVFLSTAVALTTLAAELAPPQITDQPQSQVSRTGGSITFSVTATGATPLYYQWRKNGTDLAGATGDSLVLANLQSSDLGGYTVAVSNAVGSVISRPAFPLGLRCEFEGHAYELAPSRLDWNDAEAWATARGGHLVAVNTATEHAFLLSTFGAEESFWIGLSDQNAEGVWTAWSSGEPVTFSNWTEGEPNNGTNGEPFAIMNWNMDQGIPGLGQWNDLPAGGSQTSIIEYAFIPTEPVIVTAPLDQQADPGQTVVFTVSASGSAPLTYQWTKDGSPIDGATGATLTLTNVQLTDVARYAVIVTNAFGSAASTPATLTGTRPPPTILTQPNVAVARTGSTATLSVAATGGGPLAYQWMRFGQPIPAATGATLTLASINANDAGRYDVIVADGLSVAATQPGWLITQSPPALLWVEGGIVPNVIGSYRTTPRQVFADVTVVAAGGSFTFLLKVDGTLWASGMNFSGQLGDGTTSHRGTPVQVASGVTGVAAGGSHAVFIKADHSLWAMGADGYSPPDSGNPVNHLTPVQVATDVAAVWAGAGHSVFLKRDGTLWGFGNNANGQLGDGTTTNCSTPILISGDVTSAAAAGNHTLFIKTDHTLWATGANERGQLGDGTTANHLVPLQVATEVAAVSTAYTHSLITKTNRTLWAVGSNQSGQLGDGTTVDRTSPVQIATGVEHASAGVNHSLFLQDDGSLWAVGGNASGQLGDGTTVDRLVPRELAQEVIAAAAGSGYTAYVAADRTVWTVGEGSYGQLADGMIPSATNALVATDVVAAAIGANTTLFIKNDGTLWKQDGRRIAPVPGVTNVVAVAVANYELDRFYLKADGTLWRLADDNTSLLAATDVVSFGCGLEYVAYLKRDGTLWGQNIVTGSQFGWIRFGDGVNPAQLTDQVDALSAGGWHILYVKHDRTLWGLGLIWGGWGDQAAWPDWNTYWRAHIADPIELEADIRTAVANKDWNHYTTTDGTLWTRSSGWDEWSGPAAEVATGVIASTGDAARTLYLEQDGSLWSRAGVKGTLGSPVRITGGVTALGTGVDSSFLFLQRPGDGPAPVITTAPQSLAVALHGTASLQVAVSGDGPMTYQWFKDGVALPWAREPQLTLAYANEADAGSYTVAVTNRTQTVTSSAATLTVNIPPTIQTQPQSTRVVFGATATFGVTADTSDDSALTYQWRKLGCPIPGATSPTLTIGGAELADDAFYDVIVGNLHGNTPSAPARLRVDPPAYLSGGLRIEQVGPHFEADGGLVNTSCVDPVGRLYIGGDFSRVNSLIRRCLARLNPDGSLDSSYVPADIDGLSIRAVVLQTDGKLVIAGPFSRVGGVSRRFIARLNADGSLDPTFSVGDGLDNQANALALQPDGRIIAAGDFTRYDGVACGRILRLGPDGHLDPTFDSGTGFDRGVTSIALMADGRIVVGGTFTECNGSPRAGIACLSPNGALDLTFDPGTGFDGDVNVVVVQPADQRLLVGGAFGTFNGAAGPRLVRLLPNGTRDAGFTPDVTYDGATTALAVANDSKITVSGVRNLTSEVIRLNVNGTRDTSFDSGVRAYGSRISGLLALPDNHTLITGEFGAQSGAPYVLAVAWLDADGAFDARDLSWTRKASPFGLVPLPDGKWLVAGGYTSIDGVRYGGLARFNPDWTLDSGFDTGTGFDKRVAAVVVQGDGRIVVGGEFTHFNGTPIRNLARLYPSGGLDPTFIGGDTLTCAVDGLAVTPEGKLMAGSWWFFDGDQRKFLARLNPDGSLDPSVNLGPDLAIGDPSFGVQDDGKIVVAGFASAPAEQSILRLNPAGTRDPTFAVPPGHLDLTNAVDVAADGRIVTGGWATTVQRFNPDGSFDEAFEANRDFRGGSVAIALQRDNKVVLGGFFVPRTSLVPMAPLVRLNADGRRDLTFGCPQPLATSWTTDDMLVLRALPAQLLIAGARMVADDGELCGILRVVAAPPVITTQPASQTAGAGAAVALNVAVDSTLPLTYQWRKNGVPLTDGASVTGSTTATLTLTNLTTTDAGNYTVLVDNGAGQQLTSHPATLVVHRLPASVVLGNLRQTYDGSPRTVSFTTDPAGLAVAVTYNGASAAPIYPSSYVVAATITDPNYTGSTTGTLVIATTALVRHAPAFNSGIDGSLQVLLPENITLNGSAYLSGDLLVPGTPTVRLNGHPTLAGTRDAAGSATPANHTITLNGNALVRYVVRRVDPLALPVVTAPPTPAGTRNVTLNSAGQSAGNFATLRNLTLNGKAGVVAVPPGTYGTFLANGSTGFVLGVPGATTPAVYHLQGLTLNGAASLQIVGPVVLTLGGNLTINGSAGAPDRPEWLDLHLHTGGVTLNGGATFHGNVVAPSGTVVLNGGSTLHGTVQCDRLTLNGDSLLQTH